MNILLTNDDGYDFKGIRLVREKLQKYGRVVICAPKGKMSAKSVAKTFDVPLVLGEEEKDIYSFTGTPADCVAFAITSLGIKFDLVVSGCNNGLNITNDILYSGTIGACLESLTYGVPAVAFSCEFNFEIVDKFFDDAWNFIVNNKLISNEYIINVNFPKGEVVKDIQLGRIYYRKDNNYFEKTENGYLAKRDIETVFTEIDTDCYQVENGIISITPLNRHIYNDALFEKVRTKIK